MADSIFETTFLVGRILEAEAFEEARKPKLCKLKVDLGNQIVQSAAQLLYNHTIDELVGMQVICATGMGIVNIAGYESEVLVVGVPDADGHPVLVTPSLEVPNGGALY